jgi:hypothetical protein
MTAAKFKPVAFPVSGFALSNIAKTSLTFFLKLTGSSYKSDLTNSAWIFSNDGFCQ